MELAGFPSAAALKCWIQRQRLHSVLHLVETVCGFAGFLGIVTGSGYHVGDVRHLVNRRTEFLPNFRSGDPGWPE